MIRRWERTDRKNTMCKESMRKRKCERKERKGTAEACVIVLPQSFDPGCCSCCYLEHLYLIRGKWVVSEKEKKTPSPWFLAFFSVLYSNSNAFPQFITTFLTLHPSSPPCCSWCSSCHFISLPWTLNYIKSMKLWKHNTHSASSHFRICFTDCME